MIQNLGYGSSPPRLLFGGWESVAGVVILEFHPVCRGQWIRWMVWTVGSLYLSQMQVCIITGRVIMWVHRNISTWYRRISMFYSVYLFTCVTNSNKCWLFTDLVPNCANKYKHRKGVTNVLIDFVLLSSVQIHYVVSGSETASSAVTDILLIK